MKLKATLIWLCAVLVYSTAHSQLHGVQWVLSTNTSVLDFRDDTIRAYTTEKNMPMFLTSATICDETGALLAFTDGIRVADKNGRLMLNGDSLSPCNYSNQWAINGLNIQQAAIFLPMPDNDRYFYLIHFSADTNGPRPGTYYYSLVDKEGNFGLGEVVQKNIPFFKTIGRGGGMTACKHANGRDWWIVMMKGNSNRFYKFLLTPQGISDTLIQDIGPNYPGPYDLAYSCFSEDGSKYVTSCLDGLITVMDFDRCIGEFSNPITIYNNASYEPVNEPITGATGVAFSPNGMYLYISNSYNLTQYDLWESDIQDSIEIYLRDSNDFYRIRFLELGPNGKLYASTWAGGSSFIHVINNPDLKGDSCGFTYGGQPTSSLNSVNLPNMPNYCLGALAGSGCDTITTGINDVHTLNDIRIQPNPADKFMYSEMPMQGNYTFELLNEAGQIVMSKQTKQVDIFNTEDLPSGIYLLHVKDNGKPVTSKQVVVRH